MVEDADFHRAAPVNADCPGAVRPSTARVPRFAQDEENFLIPSEG
jgi:hypothetical protein